MAVIKAKTDKNFTVIDNDIFKPGGLSWEARGLLCTLLSKPDDWNVIVKALEKETEGTRKQTKERGLWEIFKELVAAGYVVRKKRQSGEMDYFVYPVSQTAKTADCENSRLLKPQTAKTADCENVGVLINKDSTQRKEKKEKELSCDDAFAPSAPTVEVEVLPAEKIKPAKPKAEPNPLNRATWEAYCQAYKQAYGVEPLRNAKVNRQIADFVKMVGEVAPDVAAFFCFHPNHWYRTKGHDMGTLLANAQAVMTDWKRKTATTSVQAKQAEKTASNMQAAASLFAKYEAESKGGVA